MDVFKVDAKTYGWIFAFMSLSFISASQLNSLLLRKFSSEQMIFSFDCAICISITFFDCIYKSSLGLYQTIGMLFIFLACLGISNPNTAALTLAPFTKNAGSASALMRFSWARCVCFFCCGSL
jgi:DHA1 family bicyclomycin/chloramphenicol resistance-like MFS transporter